MTEPCPVLRAAGVPVIVQGDACWSECAGGGWIVEGPAASVRPLLYEQAVLAISPEPGAEGCGDTVVVATPTNPSGKATRFGQAVRLVALVHGSTAPRQRAEFLVATLPSDGRPAHFGVRNEGLFAGRWLFDPQRRSAKWPTGEAAIRTEGSPALLLRSLGWRVDGELGRNQPKLLRSDDTGAELMVLSVADGEHADPKHADRAAESARAVAATGQTPPLAAVAAGSVWRVFPPGDQPRRSVSIDVEAAGAEYVRALLGPHGLPERDFATWADGESRRYAEDLSESLRTRIHSEAMPKLAEAVARAMRARDPEASLEIAFGAAVRILFRLLLIAWAEDEGLLPYDRNEAYRGRSLTRLALRLAANPTLGAANGHGYAMFEELKSLWAVFDGGSAELGVPAYNGGMFDETTDVGEAVSRLRLEDGVVAPVLRALLTSVPTGDEATAAGTAGSSVSSSKGTRSEPAGMLDFSGMSVREFGTVYEELQDYRLSEAPADLNADLTPVAELKATASAGERAIAYRAGEPYLHDKSGQRKSTGSYFTKPFAVDHLLSEALRPALAEHLDRVSRVLAGVDGGGDPAARETSAQGAAGDAATQDAFARDAADSEASTQGAAGDAATQDAFARDAAARETSVQGAAARDAAASEASTQGVAARDATAQHAPARDAAVQDAAARDAAASEALWDFAVLDPASGSGHFLVAACDMIVDEFAKFQENNQLQGVDAALDRLRTAAKAALAGRDPAAEAMITDRQLLARLAARRCLYAIDISQMATELCKVAMWVRTFVPGLPMYSLDHQIVSGNLLLSIPTVEEAVDLLDPPAQRDGATSLIGLTVRAGIAEGLRCEMAARGSDESDPEQVAATAAARAQGREALERAQHLFDAALAVRVKYLRTDGKGRIPGATDANSIIARINDIEHPDGTLSAMLRSLDPLGRRPTHPPLLFPEVYRSDRPAGPGFDCIVGNPPWEKVLVDREVWWGIHIPGVRSLPVARRRASINEFEASRPFLAEEFESDKVRVETLKKAIRNLFSDLGAGHTDLYKAFCWANLAAARFGGMVGMVLPRSAVSDAGMTKWRRRLLENSAGGGGCRTCWQWRRSSTTRDGRSRECTTPIRWRLRPSEHLGPHLPQHRRVGLRWRRRPLHLQPHRRLQAEPASKPTGVSLTPHQMSRTWRSTRARRRPGDTLTQ